MGICSDLTFDRKARSSEATPDVSVIVPVYNVRPYLRRCIDSLIGQTLQNIEIILVDDGSADGSGTICDEYAAGDARISVIHQVNAGLSAARNTGIGQARADYLMFADSDDWVEPEFCRIPFAIAKENQADLVMFQHRLIKHGHIRKRRISIREGEKTQEEALNLLIDGVGMTAWNKLYLRDLFHANRYPEGKVYEDVALTPRLIHEAKKVFYSSAVLYNHEHREGCITSVLSDRNARDWFDARVLTAHNLSEWGFASLSELFLQISILGFASKNWNSPEITAKCFRYLRSFKRCSTRFSPTQRCIFDLCRLSPKLYRRTYRLYRFFCP